MDHPSTPHGPLANGSPGFETRDANLAGIAWFLIGLVVSTVIVCLILLKLYSTFTVKKEPDVPTAPVETLAAQRAELKLREDSLLGDYAYTSVKEKTVRIPIDRAIELTAARGLPKTNGPRTLIELQSQRAKKP